LKMYEKLSASNKIFLMKKLFNLKMVDSESITEHLIEFNTDEPVGICWDLIRCVRILQHPLNSVLMTRLRVGSIV